MCKWISITQTQLILMWLQSDKSIAETQSLEYPHPLTYRAKWSDKDQDLGPKIGTGIGAYCIVGFSSTYVVISLVRWIDITANFHFPFLWRSLWSQVVRFCTSAEQCCFSGGCWHAEGAELVPQMFVFLWEPLHSSLSLAQALSVPNWMQCLT